MLAVLPELPEVFGQVLKQYRTEKKWSQMALAEKAGLHLNAVSNLERGRRAPSLHTVFVLARALGVPANEIVRKVERVELKLVE